MLLLENSLEYCLAAEAFSPKCLKNEIILMNTAIYGRMVVGKCLEKESPQLHIIHGKDPQFVGCSVDVLHLLDKKCSGRNQCDVPGTDPDLQKEHPCHHGLTLYLEADYECFTGCRAIIPILIHLKAKSRILFERKHKHYFCVLL